MIDRSDDTSRTPLHCRYSVAVAAITAKEQGFGALSDEELRAQTERLRAEMMEKAKARGVA